MNGQVILSGVDPDEFRAAIVADVVSQITAVLSPASATPKRFASRREMAEILGWSEAKLDRRTSAGAVPSIMDEGRRSYEIDAVVQALRQQTPAAEQRAAERQAAKTAAKQKGAASE